MPSRRVHFVCPTSGHEGTLEGLVAAPCDLCAPWVRISRIRDPACARAPARTAALPDPGSIKAQIRHIPTRTTGTSPSAGRTLCNPIMGGWGRILDAAAVVTAAPETITADPPTYDAA
jgi:hypothetical protein